MDGRKGRRAAFGGSSEAVYFRHDSKHFGRRTGNVEGAISLADPWPLFEHKNIQGRDSHHSTTQVRWILVLYPCTDTCSLGAVHLTVAIFSAVDGLHEEREFQRQQPW